MKRYTIVHDNVKIHVDTEREVKQYVTNFGKGTIRVYESKVIFARTPNAIKIDRL